MARQKGHVKYVGTLGEVRHFKIKGNEGYFAGLKCHLPSSEAAKGCATRMTDPSPTSSGKVPPMIRSR